jgi:hypothetical protein
MLTVRPMRIALALLAAAAGLAGSAAAQTNDEIFPQFQWNFASPGARANAMGQAFIGVADDATAATTNPAGLVNLTRPQVYLEYKNTDHNLCHQRQLPFFLECCMACREQGGRRLHTTRIPQPARVVSAGSTCLSQHAQWLDSPGGVSCDRQRQFQWRELCRFRGRSTQQARQRWPDCFVQSP